MAEIYLTSLEDKATPRAVRSALGQFERQVPGSTEVQRRRVLDKAYQQAMERITGQKAGFRTLALKVLCWITCAARPLAPLELQHALAVEAGDSELDEDNMPRIDRIVSVCAGLVTVDEESQVIRLVHYTSQEFFQVGWRVWFPTAHDDMATVCITYLSFKHFETGLCLSYEEYKERLRIYQLYLYAVFYVGQHLHKASPKARQELIGFFEAGPALEASIQAWEIGDQRPDEVSHSSEWFDPQKKRDALFLATCLGLEDVIQLLLEKRGPPPAGPTAKAVPVSEPGTVPDIVVTGELDLINGGGDAVTARFLEEPGEQQ